MPGRGRPWRGVGEGNPDRIGTGAIADGSITEADLDSNVTSKLNAGGHQIQDEGTPLTDRTELNFTGAGVVASDDGEKTVVTIPGGGGGGSGGTDVLTELTFYDEFIYNTFPNENWESVGGSGSWNLGLTEVGGVVSRNSAGEGSSITALRLNQNSLIDTTKDFECRWRTRSGSVTLMGSRLGLTESNGIFGGTFPYSTQPSIFIWFAHNGSGNWLAQTNDNSTLNSTDTGVAIDTAFHLFEVTFVTSGTPTITFRIDGSIVASFTTDLPTQNMQMFYNVQDGENVVKVQFFDTAQLQNTR